MLDPVRLLCKCALDFTVNGIYLKCYYPMHYSTVGLQYSQKLFSRTLPLCILNSVVGEIFRGLAPANWNAFQKAPGGHLRYMEATCNLPTPQKTTFYSILVTSIKSLKLSFCLVNIYGYSHLLILGQQIRKPYHFANWI